MIKMWGIRLPTVDRPDESGDISNDYFPMDYFPFSFPIDKKNLTIRLTNTRFHSKGKYPPNQRQF